MGLARGQGWRVAGLDLLARHVSIASPPCRAEEVGFRQAAFAKLQDTRERTARLTRRAAAAERELAAAREERSRLQKLVTSLRATSAALAASAKAEATWADQPTSSVLQTLDVGPLTEQVRAARHEGFMPEDGAIHVPRAGTPQSSCVPGKRAAGRAAQERAFLDAEYVGIAVSRQRPPGSPIPRNASSSPDPYSGGSGAWPDGTVPPTPSAAQY